MTKVVVKTATEARREFFDLMNAAYYAGQETVVTKNGVRVLRMVPDSDRKIGDEKTRPHVNWAESLLDYADKADKSGRSDISRNHDKYLLERI